jgi:flagellar biosynthesis protein FlhG
MPTIVSIALGKGGVGKSVVASNLGLLLARHGKRVVLVDLDIGGANLRILFGQLHPAQVINHLISFCRVMPRWSSPILIQSQ